MKEERVVIGSLPDGSCDRGASAVACLRCNRDKHRVLSYAARLQASNKLEGVRGNNAIVVVGCPQ